MGFSDSVAQLDALVLSTFANTDDSGNPVNVIIHYANLTPDITIPCVVARPAEEEEYTPGTNTSRLRLFIRFSNSNFIQQPTDRDGVTFGANDYDINRVDADRAGGAVLYLIKRSQPWGS